MNDDAPQIPTRHATAWAVAGFVCAAVAFWLVPLVVGGIGMVAGSIAHLKQSRWGMPAAVASALAAVIGTANQFLLRS